ncbi:MAG: aminoglycoside 3'-phosphotransferase [Acidobacteria bacterium]|nr:aminoglycoside 3'-phosphotransferase [Acidobacteriota bacterium]
MHDPLPIPPLVAAQFKDWRTTFEYSYGPETATWRLRCGGQTRYLKVARLGWEPSLAREHDRMCWAAQWLPVPKALAYGQEEGVEWLLTEALPGVVAVQEELMEDPASLVPTLAEGLRTFHETPIQDCPFDFRLDQALAHIRVRVNTGLVDPTSDFHPEHQHFTPQEALKELEAKMPVSEDVVLCHGDYCLPNVLIKEGRVSGYVDLGELGLADRWWDLAVATWSLTWNLGQGWEDLFLERYRIDADPERIGYFRLLYDLTS